MKFPLSVMVKKYVLNYKLYISKLYHYIKTKLFLYRYLMESSFSILRLLKLHAAHAHFLYFEIIP